MGVVLKSGYSFTIIASHVQSQQIFIIEYYILLSELFPGFTLVWDNVRKMVKARHQGTGRQNKMMLWALAYAAKNRIATTMYNSDVVCPASDISIESYLPTEDDIYEMQKRMNYVIKRILNNHMPAFTPSNVKRHVRHQHWRESSKKSDLVILRFHILFPIHWVQKYNRKTEKINEKWFEKQRRITKLASIFQPKCSF